MKKKIAVVVNSRANYGRVKSVIEAIDKHPELELQLIAGASALLPKYSANLPLDVHERVYCVVEGGNPLTMAKSTGLALMEYASAFDRLRPDVVVVIADRHEQLAVAIAAAYQNIPVAHIQGGEVTGSIDESVRHAITKLSHLHFVATVRSAEFVRRMGEPIESIHNVGCPSIDLLDSVPAFSEFPKGGTGPALDPSKPWLLVLQHPVTSEYTSAVGQMKATLSAVSLSGMQAVWLWPNVDAGSEAMAKVLREFHEDHSAAPIHFYRNLPPEQYYTLMKGCYCMIGNSSSAIREGSYLGTPAINVGSRQQHRERAGNVVDVGYDAYEILKALSEDIPELDLMCSTRYGTGKAGERIAEVLASAEPRVQKIIGYIDHV